MFFAAEQRLSSPPHHTQCHRDLRRLYAMTAINSIGTLAALFSFDNAGGSIINFFQIGNAPFAYTEFIKS